MSDHGLGLLLKGCEHVYTDTELHERLARAARTGKPLRVKLGMDPTAPDIHLGHTVVLRKLRQFQDLGHKAVLIIGDFTSRIGDPTGRSATRPVLSDEQIRANAETYLAQAGKVLDTAPEKLELRHNSEWLGRMTFADVLRLASKMTVGQMLKRDDFRTRFEEQRPIGVHEFMYPLMQGWDSVMIESDVELGGTDQTYNNLVGRSLQEDAGQPPQVVMILPILRGLDGVKKMSKSLGNYIGVADPPTDLFGKTMSIPDELLPEWYALLTDVPESQYREEIAARPMEAKKRLATTVGAALHSAQAMREARAWWESKFQKHDRGDASEGVEVRVPSSELAGGGIAAWKLAWLAHGGPAGAISKSEARRMVEGNAFEFDGRKITDPNQVLAVAAGSSFRAGRHRGGERVKQPFVGIVRIE